MKRKIIVIVLFSLYLCGCSSTERVFKIEPRSTWNALEPLPFKPHVPERITIHHEGELFPDNENSAFHIKKTQVWGMGKDRNWSDIPYHYMIDPSGVIYEGRNVYTAGETNTTYDPSGHLLITCLGNFEEQEVTREQLKALVNMIAYCCRRYQIDPESIKGHKDYAETLCPGKDLYRYIENGYLISEVKKVIASQKEF